MINTNLYFQDCDFQASAEEPFALLDFDSDLDLPSVASSDKENYTREHIEQLVSDRAERIAVSGVRGK